MGDGRRCSDQKLLSSVLMLSTHSGPGLCGQGDRDENQKDCCVTGKG